MMLPTPSTRHVNFEHIYEPAEDSFLLLDTLSSTTESSFLQTRFPQNASPPFIVEVGTGSGVVLAFVTAQSQHIWSRQDAFSLGVDVNRFACDATSKTVKLALKDCGSRAQFLDCVNANLVSSLRTNSIDVLIFNPPYVPTEELPDIHQSFSSERSNGSQTFERDSHLLALSYAGGRHGMETTSKILDEIPRVLSDRGLAYILFCAQNRPLEIQKRVSEWPGGWSGDIVGSSGRQAGWEKLSIMRICRPN